METNQIIKNIEALSKNAMFNMSLTSKELFHSNFWAWLLRKYPTVFTSAFYKDYDEKFETKVFREKHHFDLSIEVNGNFVIIENKLKSMPDKKQLERYYNTNNKKSKILLISYFQPLSFDCIFDLYEYCSYSMLYERLSSNFSNNQEKIANDDKIIIQNYLEFLNLLIQLQNSIEFTDNDKIGKLWNIVKNKDIQYKLEQINFTKTFERIFMTKLTKRVLKDFILADFIDEIRIDCGRDLKVFSYILHYFPGAWDKDESKRCDLCFLGISLWGDEYRYYAGLHKKQCNINYPKQGRYDKENKRLGFEYLSTHYGWFFNQEQECHWNEYSDEDEMYLYKKTDISNYTVFELAEKVQCDLSLIYTYINEFCKKDN